MHGINSTTIPYYGNKMVNLHHTTTHLTQHKYMASKINVVTKPQPSGDSDGE